MALRVLLYAHQNPKGRTLAIGKKNIQVLTECCAAKFKGEKTVRCSKCGDDKGKADYSYWFPYEALRYPRTESYWYDWGEFWFGLEEFNIEGQF